MKKKTFGIFAAITAFALLFACCGCGLFDSAADGNYPYDIAVMDGYEGTEAEWLASLQESGTLYARLYREAQEGGYGGSYVQFLKEIGVGNAAEMTVQSVLGSVVRVYSVFTSGGFRPEEYAASGAGVICSLEDDTAYVITNYHVVYDAQSNGRETVSHISDKVSVYLYGSTEALEADFLGGSMEYDLALLRVQNEAVKTSEAIHAAEFGDSTSLTLGETVYAVGNPEAEGIAVTSGVVSVDAETITMSALDGSGNISMLEIRTDAAVNHGNSGGGLFNSSGQLIGIVNARAEDDTVGFGYAIPVTHALAVVQNFMDNGGKVSRAMLQIQTSVTESKAVYHEETGKLYMEEKVQVYSVSADGAGYRMGLDVGDTIVAATRIRGGEETSVAVTRSYLLTDFLLGIRLGDTVRLTLSHNGGKVEKTLVFNDSSYFVAVR